MNAFAQLLGSSTRANILEGLALAREPLTAYRLSKMYGMNVAKVYGELKKLAILNLVSASRGDRGLEYAITDENLRAVATRMAKRVIPFDRWRSSQARAERLRGGLRVVPEFSLQRKSRRTGKNFSLITKPTRIEGELDVLAVLARTKFDRKYARTGGRQYARI